MALDRRTKVVENRLRRRAARLGWKLERSRLGGDAAEGRGAQLWRLTRGDRRMPTETRGADQYGVHASTLDRIEELLNDLIEGR